MKRWGIRHKLFAILMVAMVLNVLILVVLGDNLFERLYLHNKAGELRSAARMLEKAYYADDDTLYDVIENVENRNSVIAVFLLDEDKKLEMEYFTRQRQWEKDQAEMPERAGRHAPFASLPPAKVEERLIEDLSALGAEAVVREMGGDGGRISLMKRMEGNRFLYIETPREYIRSTADLAVRYTAYLSAGILLLAAAVLYVVAGRATRPIRRIQDVADKISHMDFSEACPTSSHDELGALGESINHMSRELQSNIEQLIAANEVLQSDLERQQKADRMRRQFVANVSHDFKTPLTLIVSYAEALSDVRDSEEAEQYRTVITEEGNRLSQMVASLLELSQLESGTLRVKSSIFCIGEVLDSVYAAYRLPAEKKGLRTVRENGEEYIVRADYQKICQAASNLYDNAVKYASADGTVRIAAEEETVEGEKKCVVSVYNTAPLIPQEEMENLFISFYRGDRSRHRSGKSYGLGLAIVKAIMEMHGERYGCENVEDGVRFWFTLTLADIEE